MSTNTDMNERAVCMLLVLSLAWGGLVPPAQARVIDTVEVLELQSRKERINEVQAQLAREDVQVAMVRLGVDPAEAQLRVASLNDQELAQLEGQLDELPAAGDALALIGAVFLVLLILELTGVINIFNKA